MASIYQGKVWCDDCADGIRQRIRRHSRSWHADHYAWERMKGFDDETHYDSHDYPKYCPDDEMSDCPQHCASHDECFNTEVLGDGSKVGYFFRNALTLRGEKYVKDAVRDTQYGGVACELWVPFYDYIDCDVRTSMTIKQALAILRVQRVLQNSDENCIEGDSWFEYVKEAVDVLRNNSSYCDEFDDLGLVRHFKCQGADDVYDE